MTVAISNQSIGLKKGKNTKVYVFSRKEFDRNKVPPYAYDITEEEDCISFKCSFDSLGEPVFTIKS